MIQKLIVGVALLLLIGCATGPDSSTQTWVTSSGKDAFTDVSFSMVTVGSFSVNGSTYTESGKYYPFIGYVNGKILVGVRSGGKVRIPVGDVQLRIDEYAAWTITTGETPTGIMSTQLTPSSAPEGITASTADAISSTQQMIGGMVSPFTATTGDKAKEILKQMLAGRSLKYRAISFGQQTSTSGEVKLDSSLRDALTKLGIPFPE